MSAAPDPMAVPFVVEQGGPADESSFDCPLCGATFSHGHLACHRCPLNAGCEILKCPSCGYQFPRSSKIVDWSRRLYRLVASRAGGR